MRARWFWLLPLIGLSLACGPADPPAEGAVDAPGEIADPLEEPRPPAELFPKILATRDAMREIMGNPEIWYDDLDKLQVEADRMIALLAEFNEYCRSQKPEGVDVEGVARSVGDVEVAMSGIASGISFAEPAMWRKTGPGIDAGIAGLERRFPAGALPESIKKRPDYGTHYIRVDDAS